MIPPHPPVHALLDANARWADAVDAAEPGFFRKSALGQYPKVLWFGCADSRVPESVLTGARPGDLFVHRNIANQCHPDDDSAQAILAYAIDVVGVEHVVLAGHTHCGGALACLDAVLARARPNGAATATNPNPNENETENGPATSTPLTRWLAPLTALVASLDLSGIPPDAALDVVVHENVKRQVAHVCASAPVQQAWAAGKPIWVHGWVYDVGSGRLKDLGLSCGPGVGVVPMGG